MDHAYDNIDHNTNFHPLVKGDSIRVFHGFRDGMDCLRAVKFGLSGRTRANRVYSYEADNNPHGLFVTISLKVASEFTSGHGDQMIIEFNAAEEELEPPAWPSGSYTVQGGMSQTFGWGAKGRAARRQRQKEDEAGVDPAKNPNIHPSVPQSHRRALAFSLYQTMEHQALFMGHLNPNRITRIWVRGKGDKGYVSTQDPFHPMSREEFLTKYEAEFKDKGYKGMDPHAERRMFAPDEEFNPHEFTSRLGNRAQYLGNAWSTFEGDKHPARSFADYFSQYLWPKQIPAAFLWMKRTYGKKNEVKEMTDIQEKAYAPALDISKKMDDWQKHVDRHKGKEDFRKARSIQRAMERTKKKRELQKEEAALVDVLDEGAKFEVGKVYHQEFKGGDRVYFKPHSQNKNGSYKGMRVHHPAGARKPGKAKNDTAHDHASLPWKATPDHEIPHTLKEDAPTNCAGGGAVHGIGVGPKGEPGVAKKRKNVIMGVLRRKKNG